MNHSLAPQFWWISGVFLLLSVQHSAAQHMNEKDSPCASIVVTSDLVDCLTKARVTSDADLNTVYQDLKKRLDSSDSHRLTETQRLWIRFRDANCSAERALYDGGTGAAPAYLGCIEAMTRERTKELQITY